MVNRAAHPVDRWLDSVQQIKQYLNYIQEPRQQLKDGVNKQESLVHCASPFSRAAYYCRPHSAGHTGRLGVCGRLELSFQQGNRASRQREGRTEKAPSRYGWGLFLCAMMVGVGCGFNITSIGRLGYFRSCATILGCWFACAKMAVVAC